MGLCETQIITPSDTLSYWEGDLRNLSYFLNKRKELEFNN